MSEEFDYTPRRRQGKKGQARTAPPAPRKSSGGTGRESGEDYAPRAPRQSRQARQETGDEYVPRPARRPRPAGRSARRAAQRGSFSERFLRGKNLGRLIALIALLALVVPSVLLAVGQDRASSRASELNSLQLRLQQNPSDVATLVDLGNFFFDEGVSWEGQGDAERGLQAYAVAADYYERAVLLDPANGDVLTDLGTMYFNQGRLAGDENLVAQAMQTWQSVLSLDPEKPQALYNLGIAYAFLDQLDQARAMWQRVVEVSPGSQYAQDAQRLLEQYVGP